jgi:hypothetical protein
MELLKHIEQKISHVLANVSSKHTVIEITSDTSTVHDIPNKIFQVSPRIYLLCLHKRLCEVKVHQLNRNTRITHWSLPFVVSVVLTMFVE